LDEARRRRVAREQLRELRLRHRQQRDHQNQRGREPCGVELEVLGELRCPGRRRIGRGGGAEEAARAAANDGAPKPAPATAEELVGARFYGSTAEADGGECIGSEDESVPACVFDRGVPCVCLCVCVCECARARAWVCCVCLCMCVRVRLQRGTSYTSLESAYTEGLRATVNRAE
jgi:hypothetical protein